MQHSSLQWGVKKLSFHSNLSPVQTSDAQNQRIEAIPTDLSQPNKLLPVQSTN